MVPCVVAGSKPAPAPVRPAVDYCFQLLQLATRHSSTLLSASQFSAILNRRGAWLPTLAGFTLGAIAEPLLGAIAVAGRHWRAIAGVPCNGCHCWSAIAGRRCRMLATNSSGVHVGCHCWAPLLGPIAWVPLFGAIAGCHCWCAIAGCHCGVPWLDAIAAIAACHCEKPVREKIDQSVTPFSAAFFSALITHKNWLVLSGVYAGIIWFFLSLYWGLVLRKRPFGVGSFIISKPVELFYTFFVTVF